MKRCLGWRCKLESPHHTSRMENLRKRQAHQEREEDSGEERTQAHVLKSANIHRSRKGTLAEDTKKTKKQEESRRAPRPEGGESVREGEVCFAERC